MLVTKYPKILVITENPPRENSLGFGRTLTNILKDYPSDKILYYLPDEDYSHPDYQVFQSKFLKFGLKNKRINEPRWWVPYFNKVLNFYNHSLQSLRVPHQQLKVITEFGADVIFVVPMMYATLLEAKRINKFIRIPMFIYLMDDTMHDRWCHWGGMRQSIIKQVLRKAAGWVMISKYLAEVLAKRYGIDSPKTLILHNPVDSTMAIRTYSPLGRNKFVIAYAGSIHAFHDALFKVAEAVYIMQQEGMDVELKIYTRQDFWKNSEMTFKKWNVVNGGFVNYDQLFKTLNEADLLLCTTSFSQQHTSLVSTSVFTKLTDYMASGRLVLSYGPSYSANNRFMKENNLGITFDDPDIGALKEYIKTQIHSKGNHENLVNVQAGYIQNKSNSLSMSNEFVSFLLKEQINSFQENTFL